MTLSCIKCKKPAVTFIRYNGTHLCKNHYKEYKKATKADRELQKLGWGK